LRVLWAIKQLGPGGSERLLASLAAGHDAGRFEIETVYLLRDHDELAPRLRDHGVIVRCLAVGTGIDLRWLTRLRAVLLDGPPFDVLHVHSPLIAGFARPLLASLPPARRPALVVTEHGPWHHYQWPTRLLNLATLPVGAAHVAVSVASRTSLPWPLRRRTEVVIHGVPVGELAPLRADRAAVRAELGVADDEVVVLTVANLRPEKDYPTLLAAAGEVSRRRPNVRFLAAGGGRLEGDLRGRHRDLGLGAAFTFLGFRTDATRLMAGADLFVLPSREEGAPVTVAEALALGLPIIATRVGGVPDAVRHGVEGRIVAPGRPDELAAAIVELVDDRSARARLGAAAQARSAAYDVAHTTRSLERIYERVAAPRVRS